MIATEAIDRLFDTYNHTKIGVVGDIMLDTYWWGNVDRISPEAPVPVVALQKKELRVGGAANVALNLRALGAPTTLFAIIGKDAEGVELKGLLEKEGIYTNYIQTSTTRVTTNKVRVMGRNQQMMRLDHENTNDLSTKEEDELIANFITYVQQEKPALIILEDYNKGVLTERVIETILAFCKTHDVPTAVDPKQKNFLTYKGCTLFKPNLKEVKEGLNVLVDKIDLNTLDKIHTALHEVLEHQISLITLSEKGVFYQKENGAKIIPTHVRSIADVSGAGDTVIAVASLVYAATKNMHLAAEMANIAGGLVCEEVGTAAINKALFLKECIFLLG